MTSRVGELLRYLSGTGFVPVAARGRARSFEGSLPCLKGPVRVKLTIDDWNFLSYPTIRLLDNLPFLPELLPHVGVLGDLCYFAPGSVTLDRYDPTGAVAQCLNQVKALLDRISTQPDFRLRELQNEFVAHWLSAQAEVPWRVYLAEIDPEATAADYFIFEVGGVKNAVVATDAQEAQRLGESLGSPEVRRGCRCWIFKTSSDPAVPAQMPKTVRELFAWLKDWDEQLSAGVQKVLAMPDYLESAFAMFAVRTPVGWLGFGFKLDRLKSLGYRKNPKKYRHFLHMLGGAEPLLRLAIEEVGSQFVHSRNLSFPSLRDKRVTVVGCGAIGSFVAQALARLGGGTGGQGLLKLIDPERLGPENLGRHVLGYPALHQPKAEALAQELRRQFPHSAVHGVTVSAFEHRDLFDAGLIVDATGEEAVSELLNGLRLERNLAMPVLHVWIKGNGEAVQALWADKKGGGCYRCLLEPDPLQHRKARFKLLKSTPTRRSDGCRAYTPYAVSAPMHAAALATDMICAWLEGDPSPRFRTRSVETADVFGVKNQNLSRIKGCPACDHL
jgi:molybdopterin/thiamine biosynthesis adenylyltransferase